MRSNAAGSTGIEGLGHGIGGLLVNAIGSGRFRHRPLKRRVDACIASEQRATAPSAMQVHCSTLICPSIDPID